MEIERKCALLHLASLLGTVFIISMNWSSALCNQNYLTSYLSIALNRRSFRSNCLHAFLLKPHCNQNPSHFLSIALKSTFLALSGVTVSMPPSSQATLPLPPSPLYCSSPPSLHYEHGPVFFLRCRDEGILYWGHTSPDIVEGHAEQRSCWVFISRLRSRAEASLAMRLRPMIC